MNAGSAHRVVLCTCPSEEVAGRIAATLVEEDLAACVNVLPGVLSIYRWQGGVERDTEALMVIKTTAGRYPALEDRVQALHPYELPEIIAVPIATGLQGYLDWMEQPQ